jgi:hypothetical protein
MGIVDADKHPALTLLSEKQVDDPPGTGLIA